MAEVVSLRGEQDIRQLPINLDAEMALLGALMLNNDVLRVVADVIEPEHFYSPHHRIIFDTAAKLIRADKPATPVTMKPFLGEEKIEGNTPSAYLSRLATSATTILNARGYAEGIRDLHARRQLISICKTIESVAYDAPADLPIHKLVERFEKEVGDVTPTRRHGVDGFVPFSQVLVETVDAAAEAYRYGGDRVVGVSTGFHELDVMLGGMQGGDLIVIAGRPGSGKTALATNIGYNVAYQAWHNHEKNVVAFASYEMKRKQLGQRIMADQANISGWKVRAGRINESDFVHYAEVARVLQELPLFILDAGSLNIDSLKLRTKALHKKVPVKALVVDYIQLMEGRRNGNSNRTEEVSSISGGLKNLAKDLDIPIIALSQLSRQVELRDDKRPQLSDLRDSGSIEQDADVVALIYREAYYLQQREPAHGTDEHLTWQEKMERCHDKAEIIIPKVRHGRTGRLEMSFDGEHTRFGAPRIDDNLPGIPSDTDRTMAKKQEKKEKRKSLKGDALTLYQILRGMSDSRGTAPEPNMRNISPNARIVPVEDVRKQFVKETEGSNDLKKAATAFKNAFKALRSAEIAFYVEGTRPEPQESEWFLWMPEKAKQKKASDE